MHSLSKTVAQYMFIYFLGWAFVRFDTAGYSSSGPWRRKLWALALCSLLSSTDSEVLNRMDRILDVCANVLAEIEIEPQILPGMYMHKLALE
jgi:hypothetical protein